MAVHAGARTRWFLILVSFLVFPTLLAFSAGAGPSTAPSPESCVGWEAPPLSPGAVAVVWLRPVSAVEGDTIFLGDVACIAGDEAVVAALRKVNVGSAPLVGNDRVMNVATVRLRLRQANIPPELVDLLADEGTFVVRRATRTVSGEQIAEAVREQLTAAAPAGADVSVRVHEVDPVQVPEGEVELRLQRPPSVWNGTTTVPLEVWSDGKLVRTVWVKVDLQVTVAVLAVTRRVERGETITPAIVDVVYVPYKAHVQYVPADLQRLIDAPVRATRVIQSGTVLEDRFVEPLPDATKGSRVTLEASTAGVQVLVAGELLQDGNIGDTVQVRNVVSGARVYGRLVAPDRVVVAVPY